MGILRGCKKIDFTFAAIRNNMIIGITGHKGVLGTIIKQQLEALKVSYSVFEGDVTIKNELHSWLQQNQVSHLIHLAALVPITAVTQDFKKAVMVNVQGTMNILEVLKQLNQRPYFFYAGTCHVYRSADAPLKETDPIEPINHYGTTKYIAEVLASNFINDYPMDFCIGRIFSFYHESQKMPFLYPSIKNRLATEDLSQPFMLRGALSVRDLSNATDICFKIIALVRKGATGTFNIGTGVGTTIKDFVQSLSTVPLDITYDATEPVQYLVADTSKLKQALDIHE